MNYVALNITENMWADAVHSGKYLIKPEEISIDDLKKEKDLVNCIKNTGVRGTLAQLGVKTDTDLGSVSLEHGDVLFVVSSKGQVRLRDFSDAPKLPEYVKLKVTKYTLVTRSRLF